MLKFVNAVRSAVATGNWHAGLALALTLPDVCGRLERPELSSKARYIDWWNRYVLQDYVAYVGCKREKTIFLSGGDAYALRCAYLHAGGDNIAEQKARDALQRFHFISPPKWGSAHNNIVNGTTLQLQIDIYCEQIASAVETWMCDVSGNEEIRERMNGLLTVHSTEGGLDVDGASILVFQSTREI